MCTRLPPWQTHQSLLSKPTAQVIYTQLYGSDETVAFNKFLVEVMLPLFVWCGRCKRGSSDVCVLEERILLCMCVYSPNLWKVFLTYAADAVGKVGLLRISAGSPCSKCPFICSFRSPRSRFPSPRALRITSGTCIRPPRCLRTTCRPSPRPSQTAWWSTRRGRCGSQGKVHVTNSSVHVVFVAGLTVIWWCLRRDYGLTPYLLTTSMLRAHYAEVCRVKVIVSSRLPTREQVAVKSAIVIDRTKKKE